MLLSVYTHPNGIETGSGSRIVYDLEREAAHFGAASVAGAALRFELETAAAADALLTAVVEFDPGTRWLARCDRVDFPAGGIAYRHTHPGPGIRCLLFGSLTVTTQGHEQAIGPLDAWFESGPEPVVARASNDQPAAFVRVMFLPEQWRGQRTIQYTDPEDAKRPRRQQATLYFDQSLANLDGPRQ